jgi:hypothetical protein
MGNSMHRIKQHNQSQYLIERWLSSPVFVDLSSHLTRITAEPTDPLWSRDRSP